MTDKATGRVSEINILAFKRAHAYLKREGYHNIACPTKVWVCRWPWLYRLMERVFGINLAYKLVLLYDVIIMLRCDMIYKIPGWKESRGAQIESCVAFWLGVWTLPKKQQERIDRRLSKSMAKAVENDKVNLSPTK